MLILFFLPPPQKKQQQNRDIDVQAQFSVNQSRPEEITMREDLGSIPLMGDDGFGECLPCWLHDAILLHCLSQTSTCSVQ